MTWCSLPLPAVDFCCWLMPAELEGLSELDCLGSLAWFGNLLRAAVGSTRLFGKSGQGCSSGSSNTHAESIGFCHLTHL
jgi:hypothetical protein